MKLVVADNRFKYKSGSGALIQPSAADDSGASTQYTPAVRVQQLADVALAVYERGGPGIHVPLDSTHALVAVLKAALEREAKERSGKQWKVQAILLQTLHARWAAGQSEGAVNQDEPVASYMRLVSNQRVS